MFLRQNAIRFGRAQTAQRFQQLQLVSRNHNTTKLITSASTSLDSVGSVRVRVFVPLELLTNTIRASNASVVISPSPRVYAGPYSHRRAFDICRCALRGPYKPCLGGSWPHISEPNLDLRGDSRSSASPVAESSRSHRSLVSFSAGAFSVL